VLVERSVNLIHAGVFASERPEAIQIDDGENVVHQIDRVLRE
jgi:hypothetical protein